MVKVHHFLFNCIGLKKKLQKWNLVPFVRNAAVCPSTVINYWRVRDQLAGSVPMEASTCRRFAPFGSAGGQVEQWPTFSRGLHISNCCHSSSPRTFWGSVIVSINYILTPGFKVLNHQLMNAFSYEPMNLTRPLNFETHMGSRGRCGRRGQHLKKIPLV